MNPEELDLVIKTAFEKRAKSLEWPDEMMAKDEKGSYISPEVSSRYATYECGYVEGVIATGFSNFMNRAAEVPPQS